MEMNKMMLPAGAVALSEDEMCYTDGGAVLASIYSLAISGVSLYASVKGIMGARNWYKDFTAKNPNANITQIIDEALRQESEYVKGGDTYFEKMKRAYTVSCTVSAAPITLLAMIL